MTTLTHTPFDQSRPSSAVELLPDEVIAAASRGWKLFPVQSHGKLPLLKDWPGKASSDSTVLHDWARKHPGCNWGIVTGQVSSLVVLDVDGAEGRAALEGLKQHGLTLPETFAVTTGRTDGGTHFYFALPETDIRNNQNGKIAPHIDVRGTGGFVVSAGSTHPSGKTYSIVDPAAPVAPLPAWVAERLSTKEPQTQPANGKAAAVVKGGRTNWLVSLAGMLHKRGMAADAIEVALLAENSAKCNPPLPESKVRSIAHDIPHRYPNAECEAPESQILKPDLVRLADVQARMVNWLWEPFIPMAMLSMASGDPGAGKSFIALAIAADLTRGKLRDGRIVEPASVLYLSVENPIAEVIRKRFDDLGGDPLRLFVLRGTRFSENGEEQHGSVTLADIPLLDMAIRQTSARLIVVDPIQSYLGAGIDLHRSNETRPVLDNLSRLAEQHGCAVLLLRHLSKQTGGKAIHRGLGSIDLSGAVRSELLAGSLPDDEQARALVHIKSNCGRIGKTVGYSIDEDGRFSWTGESTVTAADLLAAPAGPEGRSAREEATAWLTDLLKSGSMEQTKVRQQAEAAGIANGTLRRAKDALRVRSFRTSWTSPWCWALPEDAQPHTEGVHTKNLSTFANLSTLQDAQPARRCSTTTLLSPLDSQGAQKTLCEHLVSTFVNNTQSSTRPEAQSYSQLLDQAEAAGVCSMEKPDFDWGNIAGSIRSGSTDVEGEL